MTLALETVRVRSSREFADCLTIAERGGPGRGHYPLSSAPTPIRGMERTLGSSYSSSAGAGARMARRSYERRPGRGGALEGIPLGIKYLSPPMCAYSSASHIRDGFKPRYDRRSPPICGARAR